MVLWVRGVRRERGVSEVSECARKRRESACGREWCAVSCGESVSEGVVRGAVTTV